jgi:XTP/dITP diphosphohydrolase
MTSELFFATTNPAKLAQLRFVVAHYRLAVDVIAAAERYGEAARYDEQGQSALEIAAAGARQVAGRLGRPVLAEDTTLETAALGGRPGVVAGAYLKAHGRRGILGELAGETDRDAWITSAVAYAEPGEAPVAWSRTVPGSITEEEHWTPGLPAWIGPSAADPLGGGYNAIFCPAGETRTLAQIPPEEGLSAGYREPLFYAALVYLMATRG